MNNNTNDTISIPIPVYKKLPPDQPDCPSPMVLFKYIGNTSFQRTTYCCSPSIIISNDDAFTLTPGQFKKIEFNLMIVSSTPATTLVIGSELLFRRGLRFIVTSVPTNNTFLYCVVVNTSSQHLSFEKNSLQFYCTTLFSYPF